MAVNIVDKPSWNSGNQDPENLKRLMSRIWKLEMSFIIKNKIVSYLSLKNETHYFYSLSQVPVDGKD